MKGLVTAVSALYVLAVGYSFLDQNWTMLIALGVVGAAVASVVLRSSDHPAEQVVEGQEASDRTGAAAAESRLERVVRPRETIDPAEDRWEIGVERIPIVGIGMIQKIFPHQVALYVPPELAPESLSGDMRVIVGAGQQERFGPGGHLLVVDCGLKTFQISHQLQMPVLDDEILQTVARARGAVTATSDVFQDQTAAALRMITEQLALIPHLSPQVIAQATSGRVTMRSSVSISVDDRNTSENRVALLRLFQQILLPAGQDPVEAVREYVKQAQRAIQAEGSYTADDILGRLSHRYEGEVRGRLHKLLGRFALVVEGYGVLGIDFEKDVQDYRDRFGQAMRDLATRLTTTAGEAEARKVDALRQAEIRIIEAESKAHAMHELAEGEAAALRQYLKMVKRFGIKDPAILGQLLLAKALEPLQASGMIVQFGGGQPQQSADPLVLQTLSQLAELRKLVQEVVDESGNWSE